MLNNLNDFWRYNGFPPCKQNVIWTIFKQTIYIFNYEFETFRDDLFFESYRGPQNLLSRKIYRSFQS
jgi:carbonic anhydrase